MKLVNLGIYNFIERPIEKNILFRIPWTTFCSWLLVAGADDDEVQNKTKQNENRRENCIQSFNQHLVCSNTAQCTMHTALYKVFKRFLAKIALVESALSKCRQLNRNSNRRFTLFGYKEEISENCVKCMLCSILTFNACNC